MATIRIKLTQDNGSTRKVHYVIAGDADRASILFNTLKDAAWAASVYVERVCGEPGCDVPVPSYANHCGDHERSY